MNSSSLHSSRRVKLGSVITYAALVIIALLMLLPLIYMLSTSLKTDKEMFLFPPTIIPRDIAWRNYIDIFSKISLLAYYKNSIIVASLATIGTLLSSSLVAFGFARYNARGKNLLFMVIISTLLLPAPALVIPQFLVFKTFGWVNTLLPLIAPAFFGSAYNIFLLRQFFTTVPNSLFEAARMDGCSELGTWWKIAIPLCKSALATVGIFMFIWCWNDLFTPVIYLSTDSMYTLPIGLASQYSPFRLKIPWNTIMVGNALALLPIIVIFIRAQKYFVEGIAISGLK